MEPSIFDGQHDAEFKIGSESPCIQLFNNNNESSLPSEFVEFVPQLDENGNYALIDNKFGISETPIIFQSNEIRNFDSAIMSSVQTLGNGNLLINAGRRSNFVEFDSTGNEVWRYMGPVSLFGPNEQGTNIIGSTFRIEKFSIFDPMFDDLDVSVKAESIELNPNLINCGITSAQSIVQLESNVYPSIFSDVLNIQSSELTNIELTIYNALGKLVIQKEVSNGERLLVDHLQAGIYFLKLRKENAEAQYKLIKP